MYYYKVTDDICKLRETLIMYSRWHIAKKSFGGYERAALINEKTVIMVVVGRGIW